MNVERRRRLCRKSDASVNAPFDLCDAARPQIEIQSLFALGRRNAWSIGGRCAIALTDRSRPGRGGTVATARNAIKFNFLQPEPDP